MFLNEATMLSIREATEADIPQIRRLADEIWWATYPEIIGEAQVRYMLELMYSSDALTNQMQSGHTFLLANDDEGEAAFASFSAIGDNVFKLHKIYVLPDRQRQGIGKFLITHVVDLIRQSGAVALDLNVNRNNPAKTFYEKLDFAVLREEDIDIGGGYWMNDYVMRLKLDRENSFVQSIPPTP